MDDEFKSDEFMDVGPLMPRLFLVTFPKSGTHLAALIARHLVQRQKPTVWVPGFKGNSFTVEPWPEEQVAGILEGQVPGTYMLGHVGYSDTYAKILEELKTAVIFLYRDMRDVAVSQAYHIESTDNKTIYHPDPDLYRDLASHEERIAAVIEGLDPFPGLFERWPYYEGWLDMPNTLALRYEEVRTDPAGTASLVLDYLIERTIDKSPIPPLIPEHSYKVALARSVELQERRELSASYRRGKPGGWVDEFTPELKELFKECSGDWLQRYDYEVDNDW